MSSRSKSKWEKLATTASLIAACAAIAAAVVAVNATRISHQTNLPLISAIVTTRYDETEKLWTEGLVVNNYGPPLRAFYCEMSAILEIHVFPEGRAPVPTFIPICGYFGAANYTGNGEGLLVGMSEKGNYTMLDSLHRDFSWGWVRDGREGFPPMWVRLHRILMVSYQDYSRTYRQEYHIVDEHGSYETSGDHALAILSIANGNRELMRSEGFDCRISALNGTALWNWYKGQYSG